jgi:hypothetical protein
MACWVAWSPISWKQVSKRLVNEWDTTYVAVSKVLCDNAAARLLLLSDLIGITLGIGGVVVSVVCARASSAAYLHLGSTQLGVVEQKGSLGGGLLFENNSGILSVALGGDLDAGDLTAGK